MLVQTGISHQVRGDLAARIADFVARALAHIRDKRRRAAWRRELLALDERQLRDAGIEPETVAGGANAARAAVRLANLNALR